jgi:hypothetical protein
MNMATGMADGRQTGAAYYRERARDMRRRAEATNEEEVRRSFLMLASHWDYLADVAEKSDKPH